MVCKDDNEAQKCMNDFRKLINEHKIIQPEIKEMNNGGYISFENGSFIKAVERIGQDKNQPVRGKRFDKFIDNIQDFIIDEEEFENAIKPFMNDTNGGDFL